MAWHGIAWHGTRSGDVKYCECLLPVSPPLLLLLPQPLCALEVAIEVENDEETEAQEP
jgi:hypothetical protein